MAILDDKVAIVTGSARGIGRATAELLAEHGARVVINDLDGDAAAQTAQEIAGETAVVITSTGDSADFDALARRAGARGFVSKAELSGAALEEFLP